MDDHHTFTAGYLSDLLGSRLCHDLVNPLGAIGNGVELLEMTGGGAGPELALIKDAVRDAQARIRFFRVAVGAAGPDQRLRAREVRETLAALYAQGRLSVTWTPDDDCARADVKLAFLMLMCAETALPMGGEVTIARDPRGLWVLTAMAGRITIDTDIWPLLHFGGGPAARPLRPSEVQFTLLPAEAANQGRRINYIADDGRLQISTD